MHGWIGFFRNPGIVGKVKIAESWARYVRRLAMYPSYLAIVPPHNNGDNILEFFREILFDYGHSISAAAVPN